MMGRIARIEMRRSQAVFIALLSVVIGAGLLVSFPQAFAGRWMQLAVVNRLNLLAFVPLALAGGASLGRRDALYRVNELFASTVRPRWQRVLPTATAFAIAVVTAYLLVFLIGAAWVIPTSAYFPITAVVVTAVGALSLIAAGWLGMAAGRAVPRLVTAPALGVVGAVVAGVLPMWLEESRRATATVANPAALLTPIHDGNLDDFQTIVARVNLAQALWLAALAVTGLLLLGAASRRAIALAVLPAVVGAAIAVSLLPAGGYRAAAAVDPAAIELVCDNDGPQVCLTRVHAGLLTDVVGPARHALTMLAKLPNAPTRAVESQQVQSWAQLSQGSGRSRHQADTLVLDLASIGPTDRAEFAGDDFLSHLVGGAWQQDCDEVTTDPLALAYPRSTETHDLYLVRMVAVAWLSGQPTTVQDSGQSEDRRRVEDAGQALARLPQAEQGRRMALTRAAALDCRTDGLMSILSGDAP